MLSTAVIRRFMPIIKIVGEIPLEILAIGFPLGWCKPQFDPSWIAGDHFLNSKWDVVMVESELDEIVWDRFIGIR